ncbi:MAG: DUF1460 domain-containing protein [Rhodothermales bacterium]|nr:DUF1460 domain-containing protein [Rhodothermales bacterium]MBO6780650.1 DUF1460 domain-containing protein [Rhodothermales bacterium]
MLRLLLLLVLFAGCSGRETPAHLPAQAAVLQTEPTHDTDAQSGAAGTRFAGSHAHAPTDSTEQRFHELMAWAVQQGLPDRPIAEIMAALGPRFLGAPYVVGPLDGFGHEVVVARLDAFDCFTFVEALLSMARGLRSGDLSWEGYLRRTEEQRYRHGKADAYCDRLHYFTEWIQVNEERGLVEDVSAEVGGMPFPKEIGFMSAHRSAYPALEDDQVYACVQEAEASLRQTLTLHFIPQEEIRQHYDRIRTGDIVSTAAGLEGLDVTHTGIALKQPDGRVSLLHASTSGGVKISEDLADYVQGVRVQQGILVARPADG